MLAPKKIKLQKIISQEFGKGINKASLFKALEQFIDENYHEARGKTMLSELIKDMEGAGGYRTWKKRFKLDIIDQLIEAGLISLQQPYTGTGDQRRTQNKQRQKLIKLLSQLKE